ncbi:MAG: hypothetical protein JWL69_304 [Phycisphaerales bacterium]|nr:hypothetical protein [Phycisphaerales bacterium]
MSRAFSFQRAVLVTAITIVSMVALPGCGSKVNDEHYNKIKTGMTEAEVKDILGAPTTTETGTGLISGSKKEWKDGDKSIGVVFMDGKVLATEKKGF